MNKAVFLDRDGVIVKNIEGQAPRTPQDLRLTLDSVPLIKKLQEKGYKIFVVSNQPDRALGLIDEKNKKAMLKKFEALLKKNNINVDGIYYCFHHPQGILKKYAKDCNRRKPKPGMLLKAIRDYKIDPAKSYIIGDRATDVKAGSLSSIKTILIDPRNSEVNYLLEYNVRADFRIKKLSDALDIII